MNNYEKYFGGIEQTVKTLAQFNTCDMCILVRGDCLRVTDMSCHDGFAAWLKQEVEE